MKISKEIIREALKKLEEEPLTFTLKKLEEIRSENPHLAEFIEAAWESYKENKPPTVEKQAAVLLSDLILLADIFRRQEEVEKLEEKFGG